MLGTPRMRRSADRAFGARPRRGVSWPIAAMLSALTALAACGSGQVATAPVPPAPAPPLIMRAALFGDPVRADAKISPRGEVLAFLAPRAGALNLWVVPIATLGAAQPVTAAANDIARYQWSADDGRLLFLQDRNGDGNFRLFVVDIAEAQTRPLTERGHTEIVGVSTDDPGGVIVAIGERAGQPAALYRIDLDTGARSLIERNARRFSRFFLDRENAVRLALKPEPDGSVSVWSKGGDAAWSSLFVIPFEDAISTNILGMEAGGRSFLMLDSVGRDRAALVRFDLESGAKTVLGESPRADVSDVWLDPSTRAPEAYAAEYLRREWRALDPEAQTDLTFLDDRLEGEARVVSRSLDDKFWLVVEDGPTIPTRSYLYNRADTENRKLTLLFRHFPALERAPLQPMAPVEIESRDGLTLVSYLTLPIGADGNGDSRPDAPIPMVLAPHDGPWARDSFGFNPLHQWLANRGYAVLSVNFRGSSGFGKAFLNQGNREWGARMQDDLIDAVQWAVDEGVAQPDRIGIFGAGYGGFAALHGLAFTPERFACGVAVGAPANLESLAAQPALFQNDPAQLYQRIGDPRDGVGRQVLRDRSPLYRAGAIARPLLLAASQGQGRGDADMLAQNGRVRRAGLVYLLFRDGPAPLARAETRLAVFAAADQFFAACLGGRAEPVGRAFAEARLVAPAGADRIEGLARFAPPPAPAPEARSEETSVTPDMTSAPEIAPVLPPAGEE